MPADLTWRKAIDKVLGESTKPLHYNEITERIIADGLRKSLGATPAATVNANSRRRSNTMAQPHRMFGSPKASSR